MGSSGPGAPHQLISDSVEAAEAVYGTSLSPRGRQVVNLGGECLGHLYSMAGINPKEGANQHLLKGLETLSSLLESSLGPYFAGSSHGLEDLLVWPLIERLCLALIDSRNGSLGVAAPLRAWEQKMRTLPTVREYCSAPNQLVA